MSSTTEWWSSALYDLASECNSVGPLEYEYWGFDGIPNLFVVVVLLVIVQATNVNLSSRDKIYVSFTFNYLNTKKCVRHLMMLYSALILVFTN